MIQGFNIKDTKEERSDWRDGSEKVTYRETL